MATTSWIQINGKLIPKEEYLGDNSRNQAPLVMPDIEPFVSPIDGQVITTRPMLKRHNKAHGVTNSADYSPEFIEGKRKEREAKTLGNTSQDKAERIEAIQRAMHRR
jgi:hypothetical protein